MVWSQTGKASWYRTNEALPFLMPVKSLPSSASIAKGLFTGKHLAFESGMQEVDADAWFYPSDADRIVALYEDSIYLQNYDAVFTLLWATNVQEPIQDSDEQALLSELEPDSALPMLIDTALQNGSNDNLSAIAVTIL